MCHFERGNISKPKVTGLCEEPTWSFSCQLLFGILTALLVSEEHRDEPYNICLIFTSAGIEWITQVIEAASQPWTRRIERCLIWAKNGQAYLPLSSSSYYLGTRTRAPGCLNIRSISNGNNFYCMDRTGLSSPATRNEHSCILITIMLLKQLSGQSPKRRWPSTVVWFIYSRYLTFSTPSLPSFPIVFYIQDSALPVLLTNADKLFHPTWMRRLDESINGFDDCNILDKITMTSMAAMAWMAVMARWLKLPIMGCTATVACSATVACYGSDGRDWIDGYIHYCCTPFGLVKLLDVCDSIWGWYNLL